MNNFNMEWDNICRICLQEGIMRPIFDENEEESLLSHKITLCSSIVVKKDANMPEQICNKCIDDLEVAYKFRSNCESSEAILRSYGAEAIEADVEEDETQSIINDSEVESKQSIGEVYKFNPPSGLDVRIVRNPIKIEPTAYEEHHNIDVDDSFAPINREPSMDHLEAGEFDEPNDESEYLDDGMIDRIERIDAIEQFEETAASSEAKPTPVLLTSVYWEAVMPDKTEKPDETDETENSDEKAEILHIKPVRTNKARQAPQPVAGVNVQQTFVKCEDGTQLIRLKRVFDPKPMKVCEICGNQYKYQHALDSHMRRHRNEKPFECDICGKGFVINFELSRHKRTHTGQKPYACKFCDRKFSDFGSRIKHERTHTGERPYTCQTCGKTFAYSHVLSSHNLTHTGEKRYHCEVCGKKFSKSHHLKAHMNTHSRHKPSKTYKFETIGTGSYREMMALIAPKVEKIDQIASENAEEDDNVEEVDASEFNYLSTDIQFDVNDPNKSIYGV